MQRTRLHFHSGHDGISEALFLEEVVQFFQGAFFICMSGRSFFFPEDKEVTEISPVPRSLELCFRFEAFVVGCLGIESAVQADMKVAAAFRAGGFSREELVDLDFFSAGAAYMHCFLRCGRLVRP